jgi:hypothetical protein
MIRSYSFWLGVRPVRFWFEGFLFRRCHRINGDLVRRARSVTSLALSVRCPRVVISVMLSLSFVCVVPISRYLFTARRACLCRRVESPCLRVCAWIPVTVRRVVSGICRGLFVHARACRSPAARSFRTHDLIFQQIPQRTPE